jgi:hypothetical protein
MFRKGLKPAYYDSWGSFTSLSRLREIMELKAAFPHVTRVEKKGDDQGKGEIVEYVCFFQTEEQKHDFLNKAKKLEFMKYNHWPNAWFPAESGAILEGSGCGRILKKIPAVPRLVGNTLCLPY